jgi:hypothetical protein
MWRLLQVLSEVFTIRKLFPVSHRALLEVIYLREQLRAHVSVALHSDLTFKQSRGDALRFFVLKRFLKSETKEFGNLQRRCESPSSYGKCVKYAAAALNFRYRRTRSYQIMEGLSPKQSSRFILQLPTHKPRRIILLVYL